MAEVADSEAVDSLSIVLPREWVEIPLDAAAFESYFRSQYDRLIASGSGSRRGVSKTARRKFDLMKAALRNDLESASVRMLAAVIVNVDDETDDDEAGSRTVELSGTAVPSGVVDDEARQDDGAKVLLATMSLSVLSRFDLGSSVPLTPSVIKLAFDLERGRSADTSIRVTNLEAPKIVHIPAGDSVKLVQLHSNTRAVPAPTDLFVQQFYVPLDATGEEVALILFTTPSLEVASVLSELFDAMMETFEILSDDSGAEGLS